MTTNWPLQAVNRQETFPTSLLLSFLVIKCENINMIEPGSAGYEERERADYFTSKLNLYATNNSLSLGKFLHSLPSSLHLQNGDNHVLPSTLGLPVPWLDEITTVEAFMENTNKKTNTRRYCCYSVWRGRGNLNVLYVYFKHIQLLYIPTVSFKSTICFFLTTAGLLSRCRNGYSRKVVRKKCVSPPGWDDLKKNFFLMHLYSTNLFWDPPVYQTPC